MAKKTLLKRRVSRNKRKSGSKGRKSKILLLVFAAVALLVVLELANMVQRKAQDIDVQAQVVRQFSGGDKPCGDFGAWDVTSVGNDQIAVSDQTNERVLFFDRQGNFLKAWGKKGTGPNDFTEISSITSDGKSTAYAIDSWGSAIHGCTTKVENTGVLHLVQSFFGPRGVVWDKGNFLIADTGTHRIVKMSSDGQVLASWGGKMGSGRQNLNNPRAVAVDSKGICYVADYENSRVQVINSSNGEFLKTLDVGAKPNEVAVDSKDRLFVSSQDGRFLKMFDTNGKYMGKLKTTTVLQTLS